MPHTTTLLTTAEVATHLHVDPSTVRRWIEDGTLPASKFGRGYRVDPADLEAFKQRARVVSRSLVAS